LISAIAKVFLQSILLCGSFRATQRLLELVDYFCRAALVKSPRSKKKGGEARFKPAS
jgi:hypothetical protein